MIPNALIPQLTTSLIIEESFNPKLVFNKTSLIINTIVNTVPFQNFKKVDYRFIDQFSYHDQKNPSAVTIDAYVNQTAMGIDKFLDHLFDFSVWPLTTLNEVKSLLGSCQLKSLECEYPKYNIYAFCLNRRWEVIQLWFKTNNELMWRKTMKYDSFIDNYFIVLV
jgi:hypothetical protein